MPVEDVQDEAVAVFLGNRLAGAVEVHLVFARESSALIVPVPDPVALDLVDGVTAGAAVVAQLLAVPVGTHHRPERILLDGFGNRGRIVVV